MKMLAHVRASTVVPLRSRRPVVYPVPAGGMVDLVPAGPALNTRSRHTCGGHTRQVLLETLADARRLGQPALLDGVRVMEMSGCFWERLKKQPDISIAVRNLHRGKLTADKVFLAASKSHYDQRKLKLSDLAPSFLKTMAKHGVTFDHISVRTVVAPFAR